MSLLPEREEKVREVQWCPYGCNGDITFLLSEVDRLRSELACRGVHTCHDQCQNPTCLLRKERDQLRERLAVAELAMEKSIERADDHSDSYCSRPIREALTKIRGENADA